MKKKKCSRGYVCSNFITLLLFAFISVATGSFRPGRGHRFRVHANLCVRGSFASRQDGFAYFRRRFRIFCRRGGAHFDDGFFFVEWDESRECIQVATGHGFLLFFSRHLD